MKILFCKSKHAFTKMKCFILTFLWIFSFKAIQADIVLSSSVGRLPGETQGKVINYNNGTRYDNGVGFVFNPGNTDSGSWNLNSIKLSFTTLGVYSGGSATFWLYAMNPGASPLNTGNPQDQLHFLGQSKTLDFTSFNSSPQLSGTQFTFDLSGLTVSSSNQYFLGISVSGNVTGSSNSYLQINSYHTAQGGHSPQQANQSGWQVPTSYSYMQNDPNSLISSTFGPTTTNVNYAYHSGGIGYELDATATSVPEPEILWLFSFAIITAILYLLNKKIYKNKICSLA